MKLVSQQQCSFLFGDSSLSGSTRYFDFCEICVCCTEKWTHFTENKDWNLFSLNPCGCISYYCMFFFKSLINLEALIFINYWKCMHSHKAKWICRAEVVAVCPLSVYRGFILYELRASIYLKSFFFFGGGGIFPLFLVIFFLTAHLSSVSWPLH